ncbi:HsdM family class I SAM-dependent methyltransferase [Lactococcus lactis]|uniref:HsdM family class I SAM-dependent methyltransferase n=1 Tax=Lactococcus lactis TaxID=1358 RepID=UPI003DA9AA08
METIESKKFRGGYYTPEKLANLISKWCIKKREDTILEPSAGDGKFVAAAHEIQKNLGKKDSGDTILAVEISEKESEKISKDYAQVINDDFFTVFENELLSKKTFDVVLGNPPFIRYQSFDNNLREKAFTNMKRFGFEPNKMTNIWVPFLLLSIQLLNEDGRMGMVIPAELLQVDYAGEIREYLIKAFDELLVLTFNENIFDNAQQEVVVLLGRKKSKNKGVRIIDFNSLDEVTMSVLKQREQNAELKILKPSKNKWLKFFLSNDEIKVFEKSQKNPIFQQADTLMEVNVGVVTGQNKFFILDKETIDKYNLQNSVKEIITRAEQIKGSSINTKILEALYDSNKKVSLFTPGEHLSESEKKYISFGEENKYHIGYKTRIRREWYRVPVSWYPEAFFLRQVHEYPRIIVNETKATNTDTLHKIRAKNKIDIENIALSFMNSYTLLQCELTGRSYGGGVLTFEPGEVRQLKIPYYEFDKNSKNDIKKLIDNNDYEGAVTLIDSFVLSEERGFTSDDINSYRNAWFKLKNRRIERKKKK